MKMRCLGVTKQLRLCKRSSPGAWPYCSLHARQPVYWVSVLATGALASYLATFIPPWSAQTQKEPPPTERFVLSPGLGVAQAERASATTFSQELQQSLTISANSASKYFADAESSFASGQYKDAAAKYALSIAVVPTASAYLNQTIALRWTSRYQEGRLAAIEGIALAKKSGARDLEAHLTFQLGTLQMLVSDATWEVTLRRAASLYDETKLDNGKATAKMNIGVGLYNEGKADKALELYEEARLIYKRTRNRLGEANVLSNLANYYRDQLLPGEAERCLASAVSIYEEVGNFQGLAGALSGQGSVYFDDDRYDQALEKYRLAERVAREHDLAHLEGLALVNIGNALISKGDLEAALKAEREALNIGEATDDYLVRGDALEYSGIAHAQAGRVEQGLADLRSALKVFSESSYVQGQIDCLLAIGQLEMESRALKEAFQSCTKALVLAEASSDRQNQAKSFLCLGSERLESGDASGAADYLRRADALYRVAGVENKYTRQAKRLRERLAVSPSPRRTARAPH